MDVSKTDIQSGPKTKWVHYKCNDDKTNTSVNTDAVLALTSVPVAINISASTNVRINIIIIVNNGKT